MIRRGSSFAFPPLSLPLLPALLVAAPAPEAVAQPAPLFGVASVSKAFTAAAVGILVEEH